MQWAALPGCWACLNCVSLVRLGNFGGRAAGQGAPGQNDQPVPRVKARVKHFAPPCCQDLLVLPSKWQPAESLTHNREISLLSHGLLSWMSTSLATVNTWSEREYVQLCRNGYSSAFVPRGGPASRDQPAGTACAFLKLQGSSGVAVSKPAALRSTWLLRSWLRGPRHSRQRWSKCFNPGQLRSWKASSRRQQFSCFDGSDSQGTSGFAVEFLIRSRGDVRHDAASMLQAEALSLGLNCPIFSWLLGACK